MRLFEHFPQDDKTRCPICGTADDKPCFLLPIDGTTRDWICEAAPTHADCISERLDKLQYNRDVGIVYMRIANAASQGRREATYPEPAGSAPLVAQPPRDVSELYHELLYAVARKFHGESRHETALRYIRDTEERACEGGSCKQNAKAQL